MDDIADMLRAATSTSGPAIPKAPAREAMRDMAQRIAAGDDGAFDELVLAADALYKGIDYQTDHSRMVSNLIRMHAAFDVLGQEAGKGNEAAFRALE